MPTELEGGGKKYYQCDECGLVYSGKEMAEKCHAWCSKHKSCNIEIIKYAVKDFSEPEEEIWSNLKRSIRKEKSP